jgi:thiamine pyrophosphate-dependent acetolactate synthase large subunit-like protein
MKIKTIKAMSPASLDEKVNKFLENNAIVVIDVEFQATLFEIYVMIRYESSKAAV